MPKPSFLYGDRKSSGRRKEGSSQKEREKEEAERKGVRPRVRPSVGPRTPILI